MHRINEEKYMGYLLVTRENLKREIEEIVDRAAIPWYDCTIDYVKDQLSKNGYDLSIEEIDDLCKEIFA